MTARVAAGPATVRTILELACRAPSVHNTQPWLWRVTGSHIDLFSDATRLLHVSDDQGRNLTISCGAALHHLRVAASTVGLSTRVTTFPDPKQPHHLAGIDLVRSRRTQQAAADRRAIEDRYTDRRRFTSWPVTYERLAALARAAAAPGVHITSVVDKPERFRLELLLQRAMDLQRNDPRYGAELDRWLDHSAVDGIPHTSVMVSERARGHPSRFSEPSAPHLDDPLRSSDGVLVLSTNHDDAAAWLQAGEALSALWLRATADGLSVVPLSQAIEMDETRLALQHELLGGLVFPQAMLRIGWQQIGRGDLPRTPRRRLDDVLLS